MPSYFTPRGYNGDPDVADDMGLYHSMYFAEGGPVPHGAVDQTSLAQLIRSLLGLERPQPSQTPIDPNEGFRWTPQSAQDAARRGGILNLQQHASGGSVRTAPMDAAGGYFQRLLDQRFLDQIMDEDLAAAEEQMPAGLPEGQIRSSASPNPFYRRAPRQVTFADGGPVNPLGEAYNRADTGPALMDMLFKDKLRQYLGERVPSAPVTPPVAFPDVFGSDNGSPGAAVGVAGDNGGISGTGGTYADGGYVPRGYFR